MRRWIVFGTMVGLAVAGLSSWGTSAGAQGSLPEGDFAPRRFEAVTLRGGDADERRRDILARARVRVDNADAAALEREALASLDELLATPLPTCRFTMSSPTGTSAKFDCVFEGGTVVKVKYGRNPEIHAEAAATRLLRLTGYPADAVALAPRLRCHGCPRFPFTTMLLQARFALPLLPADGHPHGYTDFEWVSVESKYPAPAIETESQEGWAWWELDTARLPRAELDALRLMAVFLAHWDNKDSNQRLVCLDRGIPAGGDCAQPLAMIQDVGATFGPTKVNLARWRDLPVWHDRRTCTVSMRAFPFGGASFPDAQISETGRARLARRLTAITDEQIERLFVEARFPQFQIGTDDAIDTRAWADAFRDRRRQIEEARCPDHLDS